MSKTEIAKGMRAPAPKSSHSTRKYRVEPADELIKGHSYSVVSNRKDRYGHEAAPRFILSGAHHKGGGAIMFKSLHTMNNYIMNQAGKL